MKKNKFPTFKTPQHSVKLSDNTSYRFRAASYSEMTNFLMSVYSDDKINSEVIKELSIMFIELLASSKTKLKTISELDMAKILFEIRAKTISDKLEFSVTCPNCDATNSLEVSIGSDINYDISEIDNIVLFDNTNIGVVLKKQSKIFGGNIENLSKSPEKIVAFLSIHIDSIFEGDVVYNELSIDDSNNFLQQLSYEHISKLYESVISSDSVFISKKINCTNCKEDFTVFVDDFQKIFF